MISIYLLPVFPYLSSCEMGDLIGFALSVTTGVETVAWTFHLTLFKREDYGYE